MASFISGKLPYQMCDLELNGLDRTENETNIFYQLIREDYELNFFSNPNRRKQE